MNTTILPLPNGDFTTVEHIEQHGPLTVTVHSFQMGDVEDPDLYAAEPLWKWQNTDMGKWVMANACQTPSWHRNVDPHSFGWAYSIRAELSPKDYTFWWFKWGHTLTTK
jgi:hypothetical protein